MKKIVAMLIVTAFALSVVAMGAPVDRLPAIVTPSGTEIEVPPQAIASLPDIDEERLIVPTTSASDKLVFRLKGCTILHELNDATAIKCPKGVAIAGARPDRIFHVHDLKADRQINANDVWDLGCNGSGVLVAILDTGVDDTHIELSDSIKATENFVAGSVDSDTDGHGTHVSGIVTADGVYRIRGNYATGVAPGAEIIVGKVCGDEWCYEADIIAGIQWAVEQGADVLSLSLGGGNFGGHCDDDSLAIEVNKAVSDGLLVTVSSGNDGAGVSSPACASGAIAVGAVDKSDIRASWSNYGEALDLVAPGVNILSTYSCTAAGDCGSYWYAWMSGTSMSAPHVAGTAALILQKNPEYKVNDVKEALYKTAVDLGETGRDDYYGWGRVNALGAVNYASEACSSSEDCDDNNECTIDTCNITTGTCVFEPEADNTKCNTGICCGGSCTVPTCTELGNECDDGETCTTDTCIDAGTCSASCSNTWPSCSLTSDGCCGSLCNSTNDADCPAESVCGDGYCEGADSGEDCKSCSEDCIGKTTGKPSGRYCCGNYVCETGENEEICPVDCA